MKGSVYLFFALLAGSTVSAHAFDGVNGAASRCGELDRSVEAEDIPCLVNELIDLSFPELLGAKADGRIQYHSFHSDDYFVKTSFVSGYLKASEQRVYSIDTNPKLFHTFLPVLPRPSLRAVQGILAHELMHLIDYEAASTTALLKVLKDEVFNPNDYERATDERAFERGYAQGISEYRKWLYGRLDEKALKTKKKRYYTPEEIEKWVAENKASRN